MEGDEVGRKLLQGASEGREGQEMGIGGIENRGVAVGNRHAQEAGDAQAEAGDDLEREERDGRLGMGEDHDRELARRGKSCVGISL